MVARSFRCPSIVPKRGSVRLNGARVNRRAGRVEFEIERTIRLPRGLGRNNTGTVRKPKTQSDRELGYIRNRGPPAGLSRLEGDKEWVVRPGSIKETLSDSAGP
jgi:hypothetical protein